ncbi:caspase family protein [Streptomyces yanii]|uniref:Caspase family protein n=1 Tax=Streptomyces yanii TaxID=78510 RepID=A0ABV5R569_9ACTN
MNDATPRRYALAFGTAHYTHDELPGLPGVAKDLPTVLGALAPLGYEPAPVFPRGRLDPRTPEDVVRPLLRWLTDGIGDGDILLLYYSGHGQEEGGAHYLMCSDSDPGPAEVRLSALAAHHLVELPVLKGVRRLLLVLDACYAGRGAVDALEHAVRSKLALAHAPGADHRFLESFGVLSAARITEQAHDGAFSAALAHVLTDEARLGRRASHISLPELVRALNAEFRRRGVDQRADWAQLCDDTVDGDLTTGFFLNPAYIPQLRTEGRDFDVAEQRHFVRRLGLKTAFELAEQHRRRADLVEHFSPRGTGRETVKEVGHYFTGRTRALRRLVGWLRGENDQETRVFVVTGPPGVGKSAVLGRLVARSDPSVRDSIPADTVSPGTELPPGIITVAVHARALTLAQVTAALATAVEAEEPTEAGLRERLASLDAVATVVVDALDESGSAYDEERRIARFLARLADESPRLRLLIGTRPHIVGAVTGTAHSARVMDLAAPAWTDLGDLAVYSERLLRAPHGPGSGTDLPDAYITRTAADIARASHPLYLVARLVARATASCAAHEAIPSDALPTPDPSGSPAVAIGRAFRWALAQQLNAQEAARVRDLLLPLAYAEGQGMPLPHIWAALAAPLPHRTGPTAERLLGLLHSDAVGPYVVETVDEDGRSVYRLYHQALADDLRHDAPHGVEDHWYRRLLGTVPRTADGTRLWRQADPYVLRHLPATAAAAGTLDELVTDAEFLVHAHPQGLAPVLRGLRSEDARLAATVYRDHLDRHRHLRPEDRRHILGCDAARHRHTALLGALNAGGRAGRWKPVWAAAGHSPATLSVQPVADGPGSPVVAVGSAGTGGRGTVVGADGPEIRAWDISTGRPLDLPIHAAPERVTALTSTTLHGHDLLVSGTASGAVRVHDLTTGLTSSTPSAYERPAPVTGLVPLDLRRRRVVVSAAEDGVLRAWDLADATPLPHRLLLQEGCPGGLATAIVGANPTATPRATVLERAVVVAGDHKGSLHLWDPADGEAVSSAPQPRRPPLYAVGCAVVHGLPVAVTADRDAVRMWSLRSLRPREVHAFVPPSPATTISCIELRGRPTAVLGCANGSLHLLDLMTRRLIASSAPRQPIGATSLRRPANTGHVTALHTFASGGAATAVTGAADGSVHLWDLASPPGGPSGGHTDAIAAVTCVRHRGGLVVVTAGNDTTLRLWDMDTGAPAAPQVTDAVSTFTGVTSATADDRTLVLTHAVNRPAEVWDLASGTPMDRHRPRWATAAAVGHHEGRPVAVTADHTHRIQVWDMVSGTGLYDLPGHTGPVTALACPPDGPLTVVSAQADGSVRLWRPFGENSFDVQVLHGTPPATALACVSSGGRPLALTAFGDGSVRAWDGTRDTVVAHHPAGVTALAAAFLDGRLLVATGDDGGRVAVWETDGDPWPPRLADIPVDTFTVPDPARINALEFTPDGRLVLCANRDVYSFRADSTEPRTG